MIGAILGDIIGSPYEFDQGDKTKDFPLFSEFSGFTDDSVLTVAVADGLMKAGPEADEETTCKELISAMKKWGKKYPNAGYGARFYHWVLSDDTKPYGSYGNGSAMRVSSAGWLYDTLERTLEVAEWTAKVSHNHPEGIKGAKAAAGAIFLARNGAEKDEIRQFVTERIGYDLSRTCDEIRPGYHHDESCQKTVPEAITAFLESDSYEDAVRTAVSLGGDTDTLACITGGIAEAFYGLPIRLETECINRIPDDMREIVVAFNFARRGGAEGNADPFIEGNETIEEAIAAFYEEANDENLARILYAIRQRMREDGHFIVPIIPPPVMEKMIDVDEVCVGDIVESEEELRFGFQHLVMEDDRSSWAAVFTTEKEYEKGEASSLMSMFMDQVLEGFSGDCMEAGIIINPWDKRFFLSKELIEKLLKKE